MTAHTSRSLTNTNEITGSSCIVHNSSPRGICVYASLISLGDSKGSLKVNGTVAFQLLRADMTVEISCQISGICRWLRRPDGSVNNIFLKHHPVWQLGDTRKKQAAKDIGLYSYVLSQPWFLCVRYFCLSRSLISFKKMLRRMTCRVPLRKDVLKVLPEEERKQFKCAKIVFQEIWAWKFDRFTAFHKSLLEGSILHGDVMKVFTRERT